MTVPRIKLQFSKTDYRALILGLMLIGLLLKSATLATAQSLKIADDPVQFLVDIRKIMESGKNPAYIKAFQDLESIWAGPLNQTQQKEFIGIVQRLSKKGQKAGPVFQLLMTNLATVTRQQGDINGFLIMHDYAADQYDGKTFLQILSSAQLVLDKKQLYHSNFNKLYLLSGQYRFRFDASTPATKPNEATPVDDGWGSPVAGDSNRIQLPKPQPLPAISGALLDLENATFAIVTAHDSVSFGPSTGSVSLSNGIFVGKNGKFYWPDGKTYAELEAYSFQTNNPKIAADPVRLYDERLAEPVTGTFLFQSIKHAKSSPTFPFPRFISHVNNAKLRLDRKNIQYKGGYSLIGNEVFSTSQAADPSEITVIFKEKAAFKSRSRQFALKDSVISARVAEFSIPLGKDSIFHPGVGFFYSDEAGFVRLERAEKTDFSTLPYADSYHKMKIWADAARWHLNKEKIDFYTISGKNVSSVDLESFDFFKKERFQQTGAQFGFQPLLVAANYIQTKKKQVFLPEELAASARLNPALVRKALQQLTMEGYFAYNKSTDEYAVTARGAAVILANFDRSDYDNFRISSTFPSNEELANVSVSLKDTLMTIRGVERFVVSDSLKIVGVPSDKKVIMGYNRSFNLNGRLQSANYKFTGSNLRFDYEKFFVNLNQVDSITYTPREKYAKGMTSEVGGSVQYQKGGTFYFSDSKNKSGKQKNTSGSPRIVMPDGLTVYFDQEERGSLKYPREVSFKIPKLDYDGLDKRDVEFSGTFSSGNILPPLKTILKSMSDNSLGFQYNSPATETLKLYGGKGSLKLNDTLVMDNSGLRTSGTLTYMAAAIPAREILLTADSLIASGVQATIRETTIGKAYFPKVDIKDYKLKWTPESDSLAIDSKSNAFVFYNGSTKFDGGLLVRSSGLYGSGSLKRADAELSSADIKFGKEGFVAKKAQLKIGELGKSAAEPLLLGKNVDADFNLLKGLTEISTLGEGFSSDSSGLEFPYSSYRTSISKAQWNIKTKSIVMKGDVNTSSFSSTVPEQEGLKFNGSAAVYDISKTALTVTGVPYIKTADVKIIPDKKGVSIQKNGVILPFTNARIEIDTLNVMHRMRNANIRILSRNRFEGSATYQYVTFLKDTFDIKMENFELHEIENSAAVASKRGKTSSAQVNAKDTLVRYYTTARAAVNEQDRLMLAPGIAFRGDVNLISYEPSLVLDGFLRPQLKPRNELAGSWIPYKGKPGENVTININKDLKNEVDQPLFAGIHFKAIGGIYPTFLSPKESETDENLFLAQGAMNFDSTGAFTITPPPGNDGLINQGMGLSFHDKKGLMRMAGPMKFTTSPWLTASGIGEAQIDSGRYEFNTLLVMKLPVLTAVLPVMAKKIVQTNLSEQNSDAAEASVERLSLKLAALIGQKEADAHIKKSAAEYKPLFQAAPALNAELVLSNAKLKWSDKYNAFYSIGAIGVSNFLQNDINARMEGFYELRRTDTGDEFSLYLEANPDVWYYFDYTQKQLGVTSSDMEFNDQVLAKAKSAKTKDMELIPLGPEDKITFINRFNVSYSPPRKNVKNNKSVQKKTPAKTPAKAADNKSEGF